MNSTLRLRMHNLSVGAAQPQTQLRRKSAANMADTKDTVGFLGLGSMGIGALYVSLLQRMCIYTHLCLNLLSTSVAPETQALQPTCMPTCKSKDQVCTFTIVLKLARVAYAKKVPFGKHLPQMLPKHATSLSAPCSPTMP